LAALYEQRQQDRPLAPVADTPSRLTEPAIAEPFSSVRPAAGDLPPGHLTSTGISSGTYTGHKSMPVRQDLDQQNPLDAPLEKNDV
jgi:hypothetical protein